jgi:hypothetical protein
VVHGHAALHEHARAGRIVPSDYVFNPTLDRWMYAREMAELEQGLAVRAGSAAPTKQTNWALALFVAAIMTGAGFSTSLGGLLLIAAVVVLLVERMGRKS